MIIGSANVGLDSQFESFQLSAERGQKLNYFDLRGIEATATT
jgi:hypothetical protein